MSDPSRFGMLLNVILLSVASSAATAADVWRPISKDPGGSSYAAPDTIMQYSGIKSMWQLRDNKSADSKSANGKTYLSKLSLVEYDCNHEKLALIDEAFFSGKMSDGQLVDRAGTVLGAADKWVAIKPESTEEAMMNIACGNAGGSFSFGVGYIRAALEKVKALAGFGSSVTAPPAPGVGAAATQSKP